MTAIAVITQEADIAERGRRWGAAVQAHVDVIGGPDALHRAWRRSAAIIVDAAVLPWLRSLAVPRRDHVLVLADSPEPEIWTDALALGAVGVWARDADDAVTGALTRAVDGRGEACLLAVVGASGGVGASTLVVSCAEWAHRRGASALAVDAAPDGPGLDLVAGLEHHEGLRWDEITLTDGHVAARSLSEALPGGDARVLSFGRSQRTHPETGAVLTAAQRGFDFVVGDVPRHTLAVPGLGTDLLSRSLAAVLVVPEHVTGLAAAERVMADLEGRCDRLLVVSRAVSGGLGPGQIERGLGLPVLARLRSRRALGQDVERGRGPMRSRMMRAVAGRILDALGIES
ncbi:septum site-determining protein Ssd [uncultured Aeromicrobium sp.]|uniref:septum site-determining protein Ssd n=1 Tax=uncultured Aeromicrobium sp. TaxID=337820 RepID=UPI0025F5A245|nr:septum site-determining protein Ssd [uncultured Aeromicrobium sp.]